MIDRALPILSLAALAPLLVSADEPDALAMAGTQWAQIVIHERMVIRIPRTDSNDNARPLYREPPSASGWSEEKAPKCVPSDSIIAAAMDGGDVDLSMTGGGRVRAKLGDDCPTLKFYTGFYLKRTADGLICAGRDPLRSRSGARCDIVRFRTLVARR